MSEKYIQPKKHRELSQIFSDIEKAEPKPIAASVASNIEEQKQEFLSGEINNPEFVYDKLQNSDFQAMRSELIELRIEIANHPEINPKYLPVYFSYIDRHLKVVDLMELANIINTTISETEKNQCIADYKKLNIELYGSPDLEVFDGLISELKQSINTIDLDKSALDIKEELYALLPETHGEVKPRFKPSRETIETMHDTAIDLYGSLISHVDDKKETYNPEEVAQVFRDILVEEFGESADGWQVQVVKANSINVVASDKIIKIPENRKPMSPESLKGLVAHELGVHFLRSVMGEQTDLMPLRVGFAGYYDAEEGLGMVMQQSIEGEFRDAGIPHYLVASLMEQGYDFRKTHEVMWRIKLLERVNSGIPTTQEMINTAKEDAFKTVIRISRLTNGLTWNKDLSYYNGSISVWKYIEENLNNFEQFIVMFYGKIDPNNREHERLAREAKSV